MKIWDFNTMIESFTVGAKFQILDFASPTLKKILTQIRELTAAVDKCQAAMANVAKMPGIGAAIGSTDALAASWGNVARNATAAQAAIGRAGAAGAAGGAAGGGARGRHGLGNFLGIGNGGGGGPHIGGPG